MTAPTGAGYAGVVSRTVAFGVDAVVITAVTIGVVAGIQLIVSVVSIDLHGLVEVTSPLLVAVLPALLAFYDFVFWGLAGRTPGMALLGVRVTTTTGRPVPWRSALIRAVVLGYFPIGSLWCLVDRRHQAVHDKLARTVVVRAVPQAVVATSSPP